MKFFHLSDLHIGKQLHLYSLKEDQEAILREIVEYARQIRPQAIVIAGDVYDKSVPSAEAVAVFDEFVREISRMGAELLVVAGNHDSPERLSFASSLLEREHLHIAGLPPATEEEYLKKVTLSDEYGETTFWLLPFMRPYYVRGVFPEREPESYTEAVEQILERENITPEIRNVLITHQFFTAAGKEPERSQSETIYVGNAGNVDVSAVEAFDYVAMGHLHKGQSIGKESRRYCGTPLAYSVSESGDPKTLTVVTLGEKGQEPLIEELPLYPLRAVRILKGTLEELLQMGCSDYVSLTLTDDKIPYQPREKLDLVFPNILELKVENQSTGRMLGEPEEKEQPKDPLGMFEDFYRGIHGQGLSDREQRLMTEILTQIQEERS